MNTSTILEVNRQKNQASFAECWGMSRPTTQGRRKELSWVYARGDVAIGQNAYNSVMKPASDILIDEFGPLSYLAPISEILPKCSAEQDKYVSVILDSFSNLFQKRLFYSKDEFMFRAFEFDENLVVIEWVFHEAILSLNVEKKTKYSTWSLIFLGESAKKKGDRHGKLDSLDSIPVVIKKIFQELAEKFTYV